MLNLLPLLLAGIVILAIARYNRSNKLFWQLMMSLLFGVACGSTTSYFNSSDEKDGSKCVSTVQSSTTLTISSFEAIDAALLPETLTRKSVKFARLSNIHIRDIEPLLGTTHRVNNNVNSIIDIRYHIKPFDTS